LVIDRRETRSLSDYAECAMKSLLDLRPRLCYVLRTFTAAPVYYLLFAYFRARVVRTVLRWWLVLVPYVLEHVPVRRYVNRHRLKRADTLNYSSADGQVRLVSSVGISPVTG
jgi:hypothetical protein